MTKKKGYVKEELESFTGSDFEGSLNSAYNLLRRLQRRYRNEGYEDLHFHYDFWGGSMILTGWRPMNDQEKAAAERRRAAALKAAASRKEKTRKRELAEYQRLRIKYS